MVSIKCDRCGCLIDKKEEHYLLNYYKGDTPDKEYYLDLCPECKSKFVGFMEELKCFDWDSSIERGRR